jgi:hypothetical protein
MSNQDAAKCAASILISLQKKNFVLLEKDLDNMLKCINTDGARLIFPQIQQIVVSLFEKDIYMRKLSSMIPNQCLEKALEVLISIMEQNYIGDEQKMITLIQNFFFFYLEKEIGMNREISQEELKISLLKLFHTFVSKQKNSTLFLSDRLLPASFIGIILSTIDKEKSKSLKIFGLKILMDFFTLIHSSDFLKIFVPGVMSKLKSFITGDYKLGREFISMSLNLLVVFLTLIFEKSKEDPEKQMLEMLDSMYQPAIYNRILAKNEYVASAISLVPFFKRISLMEIVIIGYYDLNQSGDIKTMINFELDSVVDRFLYLINEMIRNITVHTLEDIYSHLLLIKGYVKLYHHHLFVNTSVLRQFSICLISYLEFESHIQIFERNISFSTNYPKFIFKYLNERNESQIIEILNELSMNFIVLDHFKDLVLEDHLHQKEILFVLTHISSNQNWLELEFQDSSSFDSIIISSLLLRSLPKYITKDHQLAHILFYLLEKLGDEYLFVNQSALTSLTLIATKLNYTSINDLIVKNYDYIIDDLCNHMKYLEIYPNTPYILKSLFLHLSHIDSSITPIIEDILQNIFDSIDNHQHSTYLNSYFIVLKSFCKEKEICKKIITKCPYYTFENCKIQILEILMECFEILRDQSNVCLPVVHSIWNSLKNETKLVNKIFIVDFVGKMMELFGDFVFQRILEEYYPKLLDNLKNTTVYKHTNEFEFVCKILNFLTKMVKIYETKLSIQFDTYVFCGVIGKFIDCGVVEYEKGVLGVFQVLICYDPDPFWLYLNKQRRVVFERDACPRVEFNPKVENVGKNFKTLLALVE